MNELLQYEDVWDSALEFLRSGQYSISTGEVLVPSLMINGKEFANQATAEEGGKINLEVEFRRIFPLSFAEIIGSDSQQSYRERVNLSETSDFGKYTIQYANFLNKEIRWFRFEVWEVAGNGTFSQPVI